MNLFEGRDLVCLRGGRAVFSGLSFALPAGGALLLTGPNGSGKSSLLRLLAGLIRPAGGELLWDGTPVRKALDEHRERVAFLGHLDAVKPVLTLRENLAFWAGLGGADADRVEAALARFGLTDLAEVPARLLSAGQKRRLALARLPLSASPLWLLDEPTVGLDRASATALAEAIAAHRQNGGRVAVATHQVLELEEARTLALGDYAGEALLLEYVW